MKVKHILPLIATVVATAFGGSVCSNCNHYKLWGTTTFRNGVKLPLYVVTDDGVAGGEDTPPKKHNLRSNFVMPKDQKDKFVTFHDNSGLELIPKGMVPTNGNVGNESNGIEYKWLNGKGSISIEENQGRWNLECFGAEWFGTSKDRKETGCYPPKHIRYIYRNKGLIIAEQYHVKHPDLLTTIIVDAGAEVDITLPKNDKKLRNTLVRYYTQWIKNWYDNQ